MRKLLSIGLVAIVFTLSGCVASSSNQVFGMSASQFNQLSPSGKKQAIANYNKQQTQDQQRDSMLSDLGNLVGDVAHVHENKTISHSESGNCTNNSDGSVDCHHESSGSSVGFGIG